MSDIEEQIEWLRYYGTKSGSASQERLDAAADTLTKMNQVVEAANDFVEAVDGGFEASRIECANVFRKRLSDLNEQGESG